jgi:hypothetical protein
MQMDPIKVMLKDYQIQRALASAHVLCTFPEYCPIFQRCICSISEDLDDYHSVSKGLDIYHMISKGLD